MDDHGREPQAATTTHLLNEEVDQQRLSYSTRQSGAHARATVLVGSATVASGLQGSGEVTDWDGLVLSTIVIAALLGLRALWPRTGEEVDVRNLFTEGAASNVDAFERKLLEDKIRVLYSEERALMYTSRLMSVGFFSLFLAILASALETLVAV
ncbi:hypothetical protein [Planctomonas deserti]|uniref:hypothetical protein n=1 Tax=Planctomonas deserti TaxID=2144185 RepID=UPI000D39E79C|nr:hypothetical protein [Planctomonas deserti]